MLQKQKAKISHDVKLFSTICQNIKNDLISLDTCIKEHQICQQDSKILYIKCNLSHKLTKDIDSQIGGKISELEALSSHLQHPSSKIDDFEGLVTNIHSDIRKLELWKEQILKRVLDFKDSIALKISIVEKQLEECAKAKDTYSKFLFSNLNAVEIASYALCEILTSTESTKHTWTKGMRNLKASFDDCMKILSV